MPDAAAVVERLRSMLVEKLDVQLAREAIQPNTPLFDGGARLDSFAIVELIGLVEAEYGFEFSDGDLRPENFATVAALAGLVAKTLARN